MAGSLGEEILFPLFALSLLLRLLATGRVRTIVAIGVGALAFAAAHAPALVFLSNGWQKVARMSWVSLIATNGMLGIVFGVVYLRNGIVCAFLVRFGTDVVWHIASQLQCV
jgi:hypothetical protein